MRCLAFIALGILLFGCIQIGPGNGNITENGTANTTENGTVAQVQPEVKDCGTDLNCFIEQSRSCSVSKINYTSTGNSPGTISTLEQYMQLNKTGDNKTCELRIVILSSSFRFSEEERLLLKDYNKTEEWIDDQERRLNEAMAKMQGQEGKCIFPRGNLADVLNEIFSPTDQDGTDVLNKDFSPRIYDGANCTGSYFTDEVYYTFEEWIPLPPVCVDSDKGIDYFTNGGVGYNGSIYNDGCPDRSTVIEYYCYNNTPKFIKQKCPEGYACTDAKCALPAQGVKN